MAAPDKDIKESRKDGSIHLIHHSRTLESSNSFLQTDAIKNIWAPFTSLFSNSQINMMLMAWLPFKMEKYFSTGIMTVDMFIISALAAGIVALFNFLGYFAISASKYQPKSQTESIIVQVEPKFIGLYDELEHNEHHKALSWMISEKSKYLPKGLFLMVPEVDRFAKHNEDEDIRIPLFNVLPQDNETLYMRHKNDVYKVYFKEASDNDYQQPTDEEENEESTNSSSNKRKRNIRVLPSIMVELCYEFSSDSKIKIPPRTAMSDKRIQTPDDGNTDMNKVLDFIMTTTIEYLMVQKNEQIQSRYERGSCGWNAVQTLILSRGLDAVSLEKRNEDLLKLDLEVFLNDKEFYQQLGLPYRRGILLYGKPGTGKTSLVNAIASALNRDLYMINLKEIDSDASLNATFNSIPPNQIIVVEDCDTQSRVLHPRKQTTAAEPSDRNIFSEGFGTLCKNGGIDGTFSLATFLANLDGHCLAPGNIIILTTNHPEMLDPAIVRPGRMDLKMEMGYCSHYQIQKMYSSVMRNTEAKLEQAFLDECVPEGLLPPCEVMTCFVLYRRTPSTIPEKLSQLVSKFQNADALREEKLRSSDVLPRNTDSTIPIMDSGYSSDSEPNLKD